MAIPYRLLTKEQITEVTGYKNLELLTDLEILFVTINEVASLESCTNLKQLTLLDNGLQAISNLTPVAMTLTSLTLAHQNIQVMKNLDLPFLQELYLHGNNITT